MDKFICVGKNYLKHALELGDAVPEEPIYFIKPPSTLKSVHDAAEGSNEVEWPASGELHHELELVLRIGRDGDRSSWKFTHFTFGLDMTLRDLQAKLKKAGLPWEKAKTFRNAAVVGPWLPLKSLEEAMTVPFSLTVNGHLRQSAVATEMRFQPTEILEDVQRWFPVREGDLLFTGTPEGVGPLHDGDTLEIRGGPVHYRLICRRGSHI